MNTLDINGRTENIYRPYDFERLVEQYMGQDAAKYFHQYQERADEEVRSAQEGENSDLRFYEGQLYSNQGAFQDVLDKAYTILDLLDAKRMNRKKIAEEVREIGKIVSNQL